MKPIKFHDPNAKPDDIKAQIGVSNKFKDKDLKEQIQKIINTPEAVHTETVEEESVDITSTLEKIAGKSGVYARIPRNQLEPTPEEWNKFSPISDEKQIIMAESIYNNGLLQPIVVRALDKENKHFQILAGNTRNNLFDILYELTGDDKFLSIDAKVYWYGELTDEQAREIVTDTNYVQRANLSIRDKAFCISNKVKMLKLRKESRVTEKVAQQMNVKKSTVFYWSKLANLIDPFLDLFQEGVFSLVASSRLASFPEDIQRELYDIKDSLTNEIIMKVPAKTPPENIMELFNKVISESKKPKQQVYTLDDTWEDEGGFYMKASTKPPEGTKPFMVYIPENKLKTFLKVYEEFVVHGSSQEH